MGHCIGIYRCRGDHGWSGETIERLELLGSVFAIELCSYTILSNHYHLVIRLAPTQARSWSDEEVMVRWEKLFGIATPIGIGLADSASLEQRALAVEMVDVRRQRLTDLSWFPLKTSLVP